MGVDSDSLRSSAVEMFREAMAQAGITTSAEIAPDGRPHRFHVDDDRKGTKNGWYVLHPEPYPVGRFGSWKLGQVHSWELPFQRRPGKRDRATLEKLREEARAAQVAQIEAVQAKARRTAEYLWEQAAPAPQDHPYLKKKQIGPNGARLGHGCLVLPVRDLDGNLHSLQLISPQGEKRFLAGGRVNGCCYGIDSVRKRIYICEGFATGSSIKAATGEAVAVAFHAGNLVSVSASLRKKYPEAEIVIAGDHDQWTDGNPGRAKAIEAAKAARATFVLPRFRDSSTRPTDFNDLFRLEGVEQTRKQLQPATGAETLDALLRFVRRFVSLSEAQARAVALWIAHTWVFAAADSTPYLAVNSPEKQSGKTRLLEVLRLLVFNPWFTGRVTAAVLIRKIDAETPTFLLDESDAAFAGEKQYAEALRGILDTGYRRGGAASCCVGQGVNISYKDFSTFCPKAIAGIGKLPDTVADRSIPIKLKRARRGEVERFRERDAEREASEIAARLAVWCAANLQKLREAPREFPSQLSDRQADACEQLLAIADLADADWPKRAREAPGSRNAAH